MKLVDYFREKPIKAITISVAVISLVAITVVKQVMPSNAKNQIENVTSTYSASEIEQSTAQQCEKISLSDLCNRCAYNSDFEEQYKNKYFEFQATAYFDKYDIIYKQEKFSSSVEFNKKTIIK